LFLQTQRQGEGFLVVTGSALKSKLWAAFKLDSASLAANATKTFAVAGIVKGKALPVVEKPSPQRTGVKGKALVERRSDTPCPPEAPCGYPSNMSATNAEGTM